MQIGRPQVMLAQGEHRPLHSVPVLLCSSRMLQARTPTYKETALGSHGGSDVPMAVG